MAATVFLCNLKCFLKDVDDGNRTGVVPFLFFIIGKRAPYEFLQGFLTFASTVKVPNHIFDLFMIWL